MFRRAVRQSRLNFTEVDLHFEVDLSLGLWCGGVPHSAVKPIRSRWVTTAPSDLVRNPIRTVRLTAGAYPIVETFKFAVG